MHFFYVDQPKWKIIEYSRSKIIKSGKTIKSDSASPEEIAEVLCNERGGHGDTSLHEYCEWGPKSASPGIIDKLPDEWKFTEERAKEMFDKYGI